MAVLSPRSCESQSLPSRQRTCTRSPRASATPASASFANADDHLIARADLWLHGHLHCRHDYRVPRPGQRPTRVVCNARGLGGKGESAGFDGALTVEV